MSDNRFSETFLDEVRAAVSIADVVDPHVEWDKGRNTGHDRWACCPLHGESTPSFHVDDREGFWKCHGCGKGGDQFKFLMELNGVEFPEAVRAVAAIGGIDVPGATGEARPSRPPEQPRQTKTSPQPSAGEIRPEIVKIYDYTDRDGNLLYQVCRLQRRMPDGAWAKNKDGKGTWKTFLQRRPDGSGRWIWSLSAGEFMRKPGGDWRVYDAAKFTEGMETRFFDAGAEHTIYHHPAVEVAVAEGKTVLITEGEKDAETAVALGYCGTTNSSGSKHWTGVHAACFRDADVVICLDNDEAGARAEKLASSMKGIARRI
jgi:DNA primase